jgi:hypothetical protein
MIGVVGGETYDQRVIGGNWFTGGGQDDATIVSGQWAQVDAAVHLLGSGYGTDDVPDLLAVVMRRR